MTISRCPYLRESPSVTLQNLRTVLRRSSVAEPQSIQVSKPNIGQIVQGLLSAIAGNWHSLWNEIT
jgi:hypothetical protein